MLTSGTRLGPYVIQAPLGAGGMGEVYRAHDARLARDVAIKVLPESVSADADRLRRFEQEARAAAALNHPNILAIHDIGTEGVTYVVSELLEGQTLRELLDSGSVSVRKAIEYSVQVARGLTAAHDKNIVHRDLKPENVFITADGRVKILDFGLAKLVEPQAVAAGASMLPTKALDTTPGMVLGTVGYMSPEQVRAQAVDHRSDIFSLGAILYELLSGRRAFKGETHVETMTAILKEDPPDLPSAERGISPALARIVDRAMEKSPAARFQSASDLAFALEGLSSPSASHVGAAAAVPQSRSPRPWVAWAIAALFALASAGLGVVTYWNSQSVVERSIRVTLPTPENWSIEGSAAPNLFAVSPDGARVAFVARRPESETQIWVRRLDELSARPLPGTEGGRAPFWSPDSRVIGYFAKNMLRKIDAGGGPSSRVCDVAGIDSTNPALGGTWNSEDVIVFGTSNIGLQRVSAAGGTSTAFTTPEYASGNSPWFLPDGLHFLFKRGRYLTASDAEVLVGSLDGAPPELLLKNVSQAKFAQGHILFVREGTLMAQAFDVDSLETSGEAFPIAENVRTGVGGSSAYSVSTNGVLVYLTASAQVNNDLVWIDGAGKQVGTVGSTAAYGDVNLSPDETRAVVSVLEPGQTGRDLWIFDLALGNPKKFTFDPGDDRDPVWSPDGTMIVYTSDRRGQLAIYRQPSGGGPEEELLLQGQAGQISMDWSSLGTLLFMTSAPKVGNDLWTQPISSTGTVTGKAAAFAQTPFHETAGHFSPNGRWIAYASNLSGISEVYVGNAADPVGSGEKISMDGGTQPQWRGDGRELFYRDNLATAIMAVAVNGDGSVFDVVNTPRTVANIPLGLIRHAFDVTRDGRKFLVNKTRETREVPPLTLVVNWLPPKR